MEDHWGYWKDSGEESTLGCVSAYLVPLILNLLIAKFLLPPGYKETVAILMFIPFINVITLVILCIVGLVHLGELLYQFTIL